MLLAGDLKHITIAQTLDVNGYGIDSVVVDGTVYNETTDWTVLGQDITFTRTMAGGVAVEVKLVQSLTVATTSALAYAQGLIKIDDEAGTTGNVIIRHNILVQYGIMLLSLQK